MTGEEFLTRADHYDEWFETHLPAYASELDAIRSLLPGKGLGIEVGVGTARFAGSLAIPVGVDISLQMLLRARGRGIRAVRARAENLPFDDSVFDYVLIVTLLCFSEKPAAIIGEAVRILKKGGRLIIGMIDRESFLGRRYRSRGRSRYYREASFLSPDEVISMLLKEELTVADCRQCIFKEPGSMKKAEIPETGYGKGGFAAIAAVK